MRRLYVSVLILAGAACGSPPTTPVLEPDWMAAPRNGQASVSTGQPPSGDFRTNPGADATGVVRVALGQPLKLNGGRFTDAEGDGLVLRAEWGDGEKSHTGCGPCRVEHVYNRARTFTLTATIDDGTNQITRTFVVEVFQPEQCSTVFSASGSGTGITIGPGTVAFQAGDEITAAMSGPGQLVDTRIHQNGSYRYASLEQNGGSFFPDSVSFTVVAPAAAVGGADFNGSGGLPYTWSLKVRRCGVASQSGTVVTTGARPGAGLTPGW